MPKVPGDVPKTPEAGQRDTAVQPHDVMNPDVPGAGRPQKRPLAWNPWLAVIFVVLGYFSAQVIAGLAVSLYPLSRHWDTAQATDWMNNSTYAQFFYILLAEILSVGSIWVLFHYNKLSLKEIGLRRPKWSDPGWGVLLFLPYFIIYAIVLELIIKFVPAVNVDQQQQVGFSGAHGFAPLVVTFISLVVLPPIAEEIIVRGYLYGALKRSLPKVVAVVVTSVIFASAHLQFGSGAPLLWIAAIDTFLLSLFLIYLRDKTDGLYANMTLHALKNLLAFMSLFIWHK